jgi:Ca2+-transporting ATPase
MRTIQEIQTLFPSCATKGLSPDEVNLSRSSFGKNLLSPILTESIWLKFLGKFDDAIIRILLVAAILSFFIELFQANSSSYAFAGLALLALIMIPGFFIPTLRPLIPASLAFFSFPLFFLGIAAGHPSYEGLAVMIAVILATGVAFLSEWKSSKEFEKLNAAKEQIQAKTIRSGSVKKLSMEELVVGDHILLEMGDELPADGRILTSENLSIDQSLLTGESEAVEKHLISANQFTDGTENPSCLFRGTQVLEGSASFLITEVGDDSMIGQIAKKLGISDDNQNNQNERLLKRFSPHQETTPLQEKLSVLANRISQVGYIAAIMIFLAMLARGMFFVTPAEVFIPNSMPELLQVTHALVGYFLYMVIIIVVAVPEGLPMSVTISLALAMQKMTRAKSLVRQLVACETIGSATVICSDKTGTMTQNKMTACRVITKNSILEKTDPNWTSLTSKSIESPKTPIEWIAYNAAVNSTAHLEEKEGKLVSVGNSTEGALLLWLKENKKDYATIRANSTIKHKGLFSPERKTMSTTINHDSEEITLVKGAPEIIIASCKFMMQQDGTIQNLDAIDLGNIRQAMEQAASQAMRVLGFAIKQKTTDSDDALTLCGFICIQDPLRPEVRNAIADCKSAGIQVIMITGDNPITANAIGVEAGLAIDGKTELITSDILAQMTDEQVKEHLPKLTILARAKPLDKYRIVKLLQEMQHVVAVTGDGTNDAPALKKADVGLSMGITGTEVAKEASKIVLLDDSFSTIVKAVLWGRALYENIQRFLQFQLTINLSALVIAFFGPFIGVRPPFTVLQLLWINVIMDSFAAIALCSEEPRIGLLHQKPKTRSESIITKTMAWEIVSTALFFVIAMLALLLGMKNYGWFSGGMAPDTEWEFSPLNAHQVSIFFTTYVLFQVWNIINCRSLSAYESGLKGVFTNPTFLAIMLLILLGQIIIIQTGGSIFKVQPLGLFDWLIIIAATSIVIIKAEVSRFFQRIRKNKAQA